MKKILSAIGKKNIIIISGILLIGIAVYLNLTLQFNGDASVNTDGNSGGYALDSNGYYVNQQDDKVLGQAALVDNMNVNGESATVSEDMGVGAGGAGIENANFQDTAAADQNNYFAVAVVSRQRARDQSLELLTSVANSADALPDTKDNALKAIDAMAAEIEKEANIETLIKAKGFEDCVAVVNGSNANIIVKTEGLMPNEVAQIKEIVYEQAAILPSNTIIIEKN